MLHEHFMRCDDDVPSGSYSSVLIFDIIKVWFIRHLDCTDWLISILKFPVKRHNWSGAVVEIDFPVFHGFWYDVPSMWNGSTNNRHIHRSQLWIQTIGLVFISDGSTTNVADNFGWFTETACAWMFRNCFWKSRTIQKGNQVNQSKMISCNY